ncbi:hypothetical protein NHB34_08795 [Polynucleobacter sp. MWH-UH19D]|uniref:hypothetical protein n=1 Tax=Polynucleobacter sp. MWH-UH19D TaxID=1855610 RepID=UPI003364D01E
MNSYEILSIENAGGKYWVVTYKLSNGQTEIETIDALDHHEAFVKFRNLMIEQQKARK